MDTFLLSTAQYKAVTVSEAGNLIQTSTDGILAHENVDCRRSAGRFLADEIRSFVNIPASGTSIVDGFALRSSQYSSTTSFTVAGKSLAGDDVIDLPIGENTVYVSTGAFVPRGADIVVPIESCEVSEGRISTPHTPTKPSPGFNIRSVGSDTREWAIILKKGVQITASEVALLSACMVTEVPCFKKVRISVASTGLEVHSGLIADANRPYIINRLGESDFATCVDLADLGILKDDERSFSKLLSSSDYDVLVTTGSVSKGMTDHFKSVLESNSSEWTVLFGQLDLKPGKPTTVAVSRDKKRIVFCLPGNPASCFVTFNLFVLPCLAKLCGKQNWQLDRIRIPCVEPLQTILPDLERPEYLRAVVSLTSDSGRVVCRLIDGHQRSSRVASTVDTVGGAPVNGLVVIAPGSDSIATDKSFEVVLLPGRPIRATSNSTHILSSSTVSTETKAAAFDKLVEWLKIRNDVENIDLMNLAGFCRNCLSKWLSQSDPSLGIDNAKHFVYGMDYEEWKKLYRKGEKREHAPRLAPVATTSNPCASSIQPANSIHTFVLTISDRASAGVYEDKSGPVAGDFLTQNFTSPKGTNIVPDDTVKIRDQILNWASGGSDPKLIVTTGGTGHGPRDITPETVIPLLSKRSAGLEQLLLNKFIAVNPMFSLTRPVIGVIGLRTLVVCLPGRPEAVSEGLRILKDPVVKLMKDMNS